MKVCNEPETVDLTMNELVEIQQKCNYYTTINKAMNKKQFDDLIEEIANQASEFVCDKKIYDFEITVRITCEDGWCSANIISVN